MREWLQRQPADSSHLPAIRFTGRAYQKVNTVPPVPPWTTGVGKATTSTRTLSTFVPFNTVLVTLWLLASVSTATSLWWSVWQQAWQERMILIPVWDNLIRFPSFVFDNQWFDPHLYQLLAAWHFLTASGRVLACFLKNNKLFLSNKPPTAAQRGRLIGNSANTMWTVWNAGGAFVLVRVIGACFDAQRIHNPGARFTKAICKRRFHTDHE